MASLEDMLRSFALLSSAPAELPALGKVNGAFDRQIFFARSPYPALPRVRDARRARRAFIFGEVYSQFWVLGPY